MIILLPLLLYLLVASATALPASTSIKTMVEFFSFTCSHCANVNQKLNRYVATHHIKYLDVNIDDGPDAVATNIMYYIATDAGIGQQFKEEYFKAVGQGMVAYSKSTLTYVVKQLNNATMARLLASKVEQQHIKAKISYVADLINTYKVQVTPTFLINQTTLLSGEDVIASLIKADNQ